MSTLNFIAAEPSRLAMVPFAVLLLAITLGPWIAQHHWERHYHKLCLALAGSVCLYYLLVLKQPHELFTPGWNMSPSWLSLVRSSLSPEAFICGRKRRVVRSETPSSCLPALYSGT